MSHLSFEDKNKNNTQYTWIVFLIIGILTVWRLVHLAYFPYDLYGDEAQYWTWSLALDWGYYSKPPVIAWLIAFTTTLCGDGLFCIKLSSPLLNAATAILVYWLGSHFFGSRIGFLSAILFAVMPAISLGSMVIVTDSPLLFFWALALYSFVRALDSESGWQWWFLLGIASGMGLLSKYNMGAFAISAFFFLMLTPSYRFWLLKAQPWLAVLLAALVYLPNWIWNVQNEFPSYRHTQEISQLDRANWSIEGLLDFLSSQFGVFGPILFAILLFLLFFRFLQLWKDLRYRFLWCFFLPWFFIVLVLSMASRVHANWSIPIFITGVILVSAWLMQSGIWKKWLIVITLFTHLSIAYVMYNYDYIIQRTGLEMSVAIDPFKRVRGWSDLGHEISVIHQQYPQATLLTQNRMLTAQLMYYVYPRPVEVIKWNPDGKMRDHYDLTTTLADRLGENFLLIKSPGVLGEGFSDRFDSVVRIQEIRIDIHENWGHHYDLYLLQGFKGY